MNDLFRLVTEQDGKTHVSSVILTAEEAPESLAMDALMHSLAGWQLVIALADDITAVVVTCLRDGTVRRLSLLKTSPMEDLHGAI